MKLPFTSDKESTQAESSYQLDATLERPVPQEPQPSDTPAEPKPAQGIPSQLADAAKAALAWALFGIEWALTAFFVIGALALFPSLSSTLLLLAAIIAVPIPPIQRALDHIVELIPLTLPKFVVTATAATALFLVGLIAIPTNQPQVMPPVEDEATEVVEPAPQPTEPEEIVLTQNTEVLEYSLKSTDPLALVTCSNAEASVSTADALDLSQLGEQSITYVITSGDYVREETFMFTVRDTKAPELELTQTKAAIEEGESFDPTSYVQWAADPVDGELAYVASEPETTGTSPGDQQFYDSGWLTCEGSYDANTPGTYFLTMIACDRNGNRVTKGLTLEVTSKRNAEASGESDRQTQTFVVNQRSTIFHYPNCPSVDQMSEKNKWITDEYTADELKELGYLPCGNCHPH